jgi:tetratricopeptide (TPR) repeat protein
MFANMTPQLLRQQAQMSKNMNESQFQQQKNMAANFPGATQMQQPQQQ